MSSLRVARESAGGSLALFVGNLVSTVLLAVTSIVVARLLGPDGYGEYTLALVIPSIFLIFAGFGISTAISRYAALYVSTGEFSRAEEVTRRGIAMLFGLGAAISLVNFAVGPRLTSVLLSRGALVPYAQVASLYVFAVTMSQAATSAFVGWGKMGKVSILGVFQAVLRIAISPALILLGFGVLGAIVGNIASYAGQGAVATLAILTVELKGRSKSSVSLYRDARMMIGYGLPAFFGEIASGVASQFLTVILAAVVTNSVVGYYQAALNLTVAITLISTATSTVLLRSFATLEGIKANLAGAFDFAIRYVSLLLTPVSTFMIGSAGVLFGVIYGPFYSAGAMLLVLAGASYTPVAIGLTVLPSMFNGIGRTRLTLVLYVISATSMAVAGPLLAIWLHGGAEGVVLAILVSNSVTAVSGLALSLKHAKVRISLRPLGGIFAAAMAGCIVVLLIQGLALPQALLLFVNVVVFALVYLSTVPLFRGISLDDLQRLTLATENIAAVGRLGGWVLRYEKWMLQKAAR